MTGVRLVDLSHTVEHAHTILLGARIPICEHMCNLGALPGAGFRFFAVPVKVAGFGTFPVRALAVVEETCSGEP
jgi:arylformamidase